MELFFRGVLFLLIPNLIQFAKSEDPEPPIVDLSYVKLKGDFVIADDGTRYEAFYGIPYAQPPVGDLRFKDPQPISNWTGEYNATRVPGFCLQFTHIRQPYTITGGEDCLYLNVYRPMHNANNTELLDVIVFIHGGAFMFFGASGYKSVELMKRNFIFVTFNYRLGPFGFLSTGDEILPGNLGLKDQVAALKWVNSNICKFGGNPHSVTLSGMSAGGASVHYHMLSPLSKGFFNRAISISGVANNPWALSEDAPLKTKKLAAALDCPTSNSSIMVECLRGLPGKSIVSKVPLFLDFLYHPFTPFGPVVEPEGVENSFLNSHPSIAVKNTVSKVPWLVSFSTEEGLYPGAEFIENEEIMDDLESNWTRRAPHLLDYNFTVYERNGIVDISNKIRKFYFCDKPINESPMQMINLLTDRHFASGIAFAVKNYAKFSTHRQSPLYLYRFGYQGNISVPSRVFKLPDKKYGVNHGEDLLYIIDTKVFSKFASEEDKLMRKRMVDLWESFIRKRSAQFFDGIPLPTAQLSFNTHYDIYSPDNATSVNERDLGNLDFWISLPLTEVETPPTPRPTDCPPFY